MPLPQGTPNINLNSATFDNTGTHWFTGQNGYYGRLNPKTGITKVFKAPRGRGPYGICTAPDESVYYASLAGNHIARINTQTGKAEVIEPRVLSRIHGHIQQAQNGPRSVPWQHARSSLRSTSLRPFNWRNPAINR